MLNITLLHLTFINVTDALLFSGPSNYNVRNSNFKNMASFILYQPGVFSIFNSNFHRNLKSIVFKERDDYNKCNDFYSSATVIQNCAFYESKSAIVNVVDNGGYDLMIWDCLFYRCTCSSSDNIIRFQKKNLKMKNLCFLQCYSEKSNVIFYTYQFDEYASGSVEATDFTVLEYYNEPHVNAQSFMCSYTGQFKVTKSNFSYISTTNGNTASLFSVSPSSSKGKSFELTYCLFTNGYQNKLLQSDEYGYFWMKYLYFYNNTWPGNTDGLFKVKPVNGKKVSVENTCFDKNVVPLFQYDLSNADFRECFFDISKEEIFLSKTVQSKFTNCNFISEVPTIDIQISRIATCVVYLPTSSPSPSRSLSETETRSPSRSLSETETISPSTSLSETETISPSISLSETETISPSRHLSETEIISQSTSLSETEIISPSRPLSETEIISQSISLSETENSTTSETSSPIITSSSLKQKNKIYIYIIVPFVAIILIIVIIILIKKCIEKRHDYILFSSYLLSDPSIAQSDNISSTSSIDDPFQHKGEYEIIL